MLTYQEQLALVDRKLATVKVNGNLSTFKYARKVMFDYLWDQHPELLECRGHTYDNTTGQLVIASPRKSFNYLENAWWKDVPLNTPVRMYKKINGYMACASLHNSEFIVSTTGTTTSEYAQWARTYIEGLGLKSIAKEGLTYLFEIVHPQDPHIVAERIGLHYLGLRCNETGLFYPSVAQEVTPGFGEWTLKTAIEYAQTDRGEGFMLYTQDENGVYSEACKLKTPYYVGKKKLMRMSGAKVESMFTNPSNTVASLPPMFEVVVRDIINTQTAESWIATPEQDRRLFLEDLLDA